MIVDIEVLANMWNTCKEYMVPKDRQAAADHVVSVIAEYDISERDLKALAGTDSYMKRAVTDYLGEEENDDYEDNDEDEDY